MRQLDSAYSQGTFYRVPLVWPGEFPPEGRIRVPYIALVTDQPANPQPATLGIPLPGQVRARFDHGITPCRVRRLWGGEWSAQSEALISGPPGFRGVDELSANCDIPSVTLLPGKDQEDLPLAAADAPRGGFVVSKGDSRKESRRSR